MNHQETATEFFKLACASGLSSSFIALAPLLIESAQLSLDQNIQVTHHQHHKTTFEIPMGEALWKAALRQIDGSDYRFVGGFFKPQTASFLNQVCPGFFEPGRHGHDPMDLIANLLDLFDEPQLIFSTKTRAGKRITDSGAAWIGAVLDLQSADRFQTDVATKVWKTLLRLPNQEGIEAFLRKRPDAWLIVDENERPLIKATAQHLKAEVWDSFLDSGQDPQQPLSNKPFWQALLSAKSNSLPAGDSMRARIGQWLENEWKAGRADAQMENQLVQIKLLKAFPQGTGTKPTITQAKEILRDAPPSWVWNDFPGRSMPAFMALLGSTTPGKNSKPALATSEWASFFHAEGPLSSALGEEGIHIVKIAAAIASNQLEKFPSNACQAALENPYLKELVEKLSKTTQTNSEQWMSLLRAQLLECRLPEIQPKHSRPRI